MRRNLTLLLLACTGFFSHAKEIKKNDNKPVVSVDSLDQKMVNWYNQDGNTSDFYGASVDACYEYLAGKKPIKNIVVAVIDGGVDINHEDLKDKIWINKSEIPGNGIDDDNNGYVDDVNGWNFMGSSDGSNVEYENLEFVRIYRKYFKSFLGKDAKEIPDDQETEYQYYLRAKSMFDVEKNKYDKLNTNLIRLASRIHKEESILKKFLNKDHIKVEDIIKVRSSDSQVETAKNYMLSLYNKGFSHESFKSIRGRVDLQLDTLLNLKYLGRERIIGDDISDIDDLGYGNNDVIGPRADHGTHVAGIIGADRDNELGIKGVASNVVIMPVRVVPNGDEYDKDVALAIRYAVDNGAQIINMSFGKAFSPQKHLVDEAVKYADSKNVLIIHAAGNDASNLDEVVSYPDKEYENGELANNWISVGASAAYLNTDFVGVFSNYGYDKVDLFAPGVDIPSLFPGNKYIINSGTSMACPVVSGVAALIWAYYPELSASQLKTILINSVQPYSKLKVYKPNITGGTKKKTKFGKLSNTGGLINALNAIKLAEGSFEIGKKKKR
nr:S8 family peptidase [uncultured Carboxylicivirga sp.]